jgi:hypothetical protein
MATVANVGEFCFDHDARHQILRGSQARSAGHRDVEPVGHGQHPTAYETPIPRKYGARQPPGLVEAKRVRTSADTVAISVLLNNV